MKTLIHYITTILLTLLLASTVSAFAGGDGTSGSPFQIANATHLQNVSANLSAHYVLNNDVVFNVTPFISSPGFAPIGNDTNPFTGVFNGLGFRIVDLYINLTTNDVGLFGVSSGTIANTSLILANVTGAQNTGVLAGRSSGTIFNVSVSGAVNGTNFVGGLVGLNTGIVSESSSSGSVSGADNVGGLLGESQGDVVQSYSNSSVQGGNNLGGLIGSFADSGAPVINNSYARGAVTGDDTCAGFIGLADPSLVIANSYSTGFVTCTANAGGFLAVVGLPGADMTALFFDNETSGETSVVGTEVGLPTINMTDNSTFIAAGWNFTNVWAQDDSINDGYPYLQWQTSFFQDETSPTITIHSPSTGSFNEVEFLVNATVTDDVAVDTIWFNWNGTNTTYIVPVNVTFPESEVTFVVYANDTSGNEANASVSFTVDLTEPVISSRTVSSITTSSAVVTWSTNEAASSLVNYSTTTSLGTLSSSSSLVTSHSRTLSGLDDDTLYYYRVTSCDAAGNCETSAQGTFTTDQTSSGSGGSSGGGSAIVAMTLTDIAQTRTLAVGRDLSFRLTPSDSSRRLVVESVSNDSATFSIQGLSGDVVVDLDEVLELDVSGNGRFDMRLGLTRLGQNTATFTMRRGSGELVEPVVVEPEVEPVVEESTPGGSTPGEDVVEEVPVVEEESSQDAQEEEQRSIPWGLVFVLVLVLVALGAFLLLKKQ